MAAIYLALQWVEEDKPLHSLICQGSCAVLKCLQSLVYWSSPVFWHCSESNGWGYCLSLHGFQCIQQFVDIKMLMNVQTMQHRETTLSDRVVDFSKTETKVNTKRKKKANGGSVARSKERNGGININYYILILIFSWQKQWKILCWNAQNEVIRVQCHKEVKYLVS